jgi:hypothetical protein
MTLREFAAVAIMFCLFGPGLVITCVVIYVKERIDNRRRPKWSEYGTPGAFEVLVTSPASSSVPDDDPD